MFPPREVGPGQDVGGRRRWWKKAEAAAERKKKEEIFDTEERLPSVGGEIKMTPETSKHRVSRWDGVEIEKHRVKVRN